MPRAISMKKNNKQEKLEAILAKQNVESKDIQKRFSLADTLISRLNKKQMKK